MILLTRHIRRTIIRLGVLALLALALFPPSASHSVAWAQSTPPTATPDTAPIPAAAVPQGGAQVFLPLINGGAAAPDLIFTPDQVELAPGAAASVSVRVEPAADLRDATFELPGVQEGVSSRFEAGPDGMTGTLIVEANEAAAADERALTVQGTSGDGAHGWVGNLTVKTQPSASATKYFVDPVKGNDANAGTQDKPFKTLAKALTTAKKGDTVILGKGVYSETSNGEQYTEGSTQVQVPSGVTIQGTLEGQVRVSVLQGAPGATGLNFAGDATVKNLALSGFDRALLATQGKQSLSNLFMTQNIEGLFLRQSAQATLTGSTINLRANTQGVFLEGQAQFTMDGGRITRGGANCDFSTGIGATGASQMTLKNEATLEDIAGNALHLDFTSKVTLIGATIKRTLPGGCFAQPSVTILGSASLSLRNSQVTNSGGRDTVGISLASATPSTLTLIGSTISGFKGSNSGVGVALASNAKLIVSGGSRIMANEVGINAQQRSNVNITITDSEVSNNNTGITALSGSNVNITITGSKLNNNNAGINTIVGSNVNITITGSEVSHNNVGLLSGFNLKLRNSRVTGNGTGILLSGVFTDLGRAGDPGGNTIQNNTITGVTFDKSITPFGGVEAADNIWNPLTQGTNISGLYPHVLVTGLSSAAQGKNFDMPNGNFSIQL
jgi:hypothetical protein